MKALIIYRDINSAAKANSVLINSAHQPGIDIEWNVRPWRVDMLKFPPTASEALFDAVDAHILVFAGDCSQSFPFWLEEWLERWAKNRQIVDPALATVSFTFPEDAKALAMSDLNRFAIRHGLRVVRGDQSAIGGNSSLSVDSSSATSSGLSLNAGPPLEPPGGIGGRI